MSLGSVYFREQAAKCRARAASLDDAQTQAALLELANEYIDQAEQIERREAAIEGGSSA